MDAEVATFAERFRRDLVAFGPRLAAAAVVVVASWVAARVVGVLVRRFAGARGLDPDLMKLLGRVARGTLVVFGAVTALGTLGLDVSALVAGLGLTGFALGFALRDIISNTLAGVLILLFRPFQRGDHVSVAGAEGVVADVDLRYTTLVVDEGTRVLVPNSTLFTNAIRVQRRR
ncbi:MAG TPA: mechanosensitive ion channel domain-containing protein [Anaeromyxobacter sp.]|nr:mechanosensitive ion channel domain-containing protein [Anaeromyxobacter sp.]